MKHILIAALAALTLSSCVATSGDLRDLAASWEEAEQGLITHDELIGAIEAKAGEIEDRATGVASSLPSTTGGWIGLLGVIGTVLGGTAAGAKKWTNADRDKRRKARGERISVPVE